MISFQLNSAIGELAKEARLDAALGSTKTLAKLIKNCQMIDGAEGKEIFLDNVKYLIGGGNVCDFPHSENSEGKPTLVFANGGRDFLLQVIYHAICHESDSRNLIVLDQRQYEIIGRHEAWLHGFGISLLPTRYRASDSSPVWTPYPDSWQEAKETIVNTVSYAPGTWVWICTRSPMCTQREFEINNGIASVMLQLASTLPIAPLVKVIDFENIEGSAYRVRDLAFSRNMTIGEMRSFLNHEED